MTGSNHNTLSFRRNQNAERRLLERLAAEEQVSVRLIDVQGGDAAAHLHHYITSDISPGGIQLYASHNFEFGEQVEVTIRLTHFSRAHTLQGVIRWRDKADSSGYLFGIELINQHALRAWCREFH